MRGSGVVSKRKPEPANASLPAVLVAALLLLGLLAGVGPATGTEEGPEQERENGPSPPSLEHAQRLLPENPLFPVEAPEREPAAQTEDLVPAPDPQNLRPTEPPEPALDERGDPPETPLTIPASTHDCRPHPAIAITQDEGPGGFAVVQEPTTGTAVPRPGSGVIRGSGTQDDPYVIEGWCFQGVPLTGGDRSAIRIQDTDAHVVIQHNTISDYAWDGIRLDGANNVTVQHNHLLYLDTAIWAESGRNLEFRDNEIQDSWNSAFYLEDTQGTKILDNEMDGDYYGILGWSNRDLDVRHNLFRPLDQHVYLFETSGADFWWNEFQGGHFGITLVESEQVFLTHNTFDLLWATSFEAWGVDGLSVHNNLFESYGHTAVYVSLYSNTTFAHNTFAGSSGGILAYWGETLTVDHNEFETFEYGLSLHHTEHALVEHNTFEWNWYAIVASHSGLTLRDNTLESSRIGLWGTDLDGHEVGIRDNTIRGGLGAVSLWGADHVEVHGNLIEDHWSYGLFLAPTGSADIRNNELRDNGFVGIQVDGGEETLIEGNTVRGHYGIGISVNSGIPRPYPRPLDALAPADHSGGEDFPGAASFVSITDNDLTEGGHGIRTRGREVHVEGNTLISQDGPQIVVGNAWLGTVKDNELALGNPNQVVVDSSRHMEITGNGLYGDDDQILLSSSEDLVVRDNSLSSGGLVVNGVQRSHYVHTIDDSNTVGGHPVLYVKDEEDVQVTGTPAQVILVGAHRAKVDGLAFDGGIMPLVVVASDDVEVTNSTFTQAEIGFMAFQSDRLGLTGNTFEDLWVGTLLFDTVDAQVDGNGHTQTFFALAAMQTHALQVTGIDVRDSSHGILLWESVGARIGPGIIGSGSGIAMDVWNSRDVEIQGLGITGFPVGIKFSSSRGITLENSTVEGSGQGIWFEASRDAKVQGNEITRNELGLRLDDHDGGGHLVQGNNIHQNDVHGVESDSPFPLDARENWWGCPEGPGSGGCDTVEGDVETDPWLVDRVPDAGI